MPYERPTRGRPLLPALPDSRWLALMAQGDGTTFNAGEALRGRHLHAAFTPWSPFIDVDEAGNVVGGHDLVGWHGGDLARA